MRAWLYRVEDYLLASLLLLMVVLAGFDIVARLAFGGGVVWIAPLLRMLVLWVGLLGALLATRTGEHIAVDIIGRLAPERIKQPLAVLNGLVSAFVCLVIAWYSQEFVRFAYEFADVAFSGLPAWPFQLIIPISFMLMALRFFGQALSQAIAMIRKTA